MLQKREETKYSGLEVSNNNNNNNSNNDSQATNTIIKRPAPLPMNKKRQEKRE